MVTAAVVTVVLVMPTVPAVVMATVPMRVAAPVGAAHPPMVAVTLPARLVVDVAGAVAVPDAADPDVLAAVPVPVARRPDVTRAWCRHHFVAHRWRRCADADADTDLCRRRRRESCGGAPCNGERGKQCEFACLHNAPPSCPADFWPRVEGNHELQHDACFTDRSFRLRRVRVCSRCAPFDDCSAPIVET